jgi:hypothetical protein
LLRAVRYAPTRSGDVAESENEDENENEDEDEDEDQGDGMRGAGTV